MSDSDSTKYCACGCGQPAPIATKTDTKRGWVKGQPLTYVRGHHPHVNPSHRCSCGCNRTREECSTLKRTEYRQWWADVYPHVPYCTCCCGCGTETSLAPFTTAERGWVKDEPKPFLRGHNTPKPPNIKRTPIRPELPTPCVIWHASRTRKGYGMLGRNGKSYYAHRYYYEMERGPIPDGHTLHHLCHQRACCNVEHLVALPMGEHMRLYHTPNKRSVQ